MYRVHSAQVALQRFNFEVVDAVVAADDGQTLNRSWAAHPPTVAAVAVSTEGEVPLLRQYRVAIDAWNLELPGGRVDPDDAELADAALRELREEVGFVADRIESLGGFFNSPGHCSQRSELFLARDLHRIERRLDAGEEATSSLEFVRLGDVERLIASGRVQDAKTIIGLLLARARCAV